MARFTKTPPFVAALLLVVACGLIASHSRAALSTTDSQKAPIHQLRIYEIFEGNKQAFHERFRDHAARIMARYNFKIVAIWESRTNDRTEFVYLLEWPDERTMRDRWAAFMADQEWADIKKRTAAVHGPLVGKIEERVLQMMDYSPGPKRFIPLAGRPALRASQSEAQTVRIQ